MPPFGPISRRKLISTFREFGFEGPYAGGKHEFRKSYEIMAGWETTPDAIPDRTAAMLDFGRIWQAAEMIVYSRTA